MVVQTAQDFVLGQVEGGLLPMRLAARLHLAQFRFQRAVALAKALDQASEALEKPRAEAEEDPVALWNRLTGSQRS